MSRKAPEQTPAVDHDITAFSAGVSEVIRREQGNWDGLLGQVPNMATDDTTQEPNKPRRRRLLIADILSELRDYLLSRIPEGDARALLAEHEPRAGYGNATPVDDDVRLVLSLLHMIGSAMRCKDQQFDDLVFGLRDANRQAGTRKERRPEITEWIDTELSRNPGAKSPELWAAAPDWLTDQIGYRRFADRVTGRRNTRK